MNFCMSIAVNLCQPVTNIHSQRTVLRSSVGSCPPVGVSDLGNTTSLSTDGIVPATFRAADGSVAPIDADFKA